MVTICFKFLSKHSLSFFISFIAILDFLKSQSSIHSLLFTEKPKQFRLSPPHFTAVASFSVTKIFFLLMKGASFSSYTIALDIINPLCLKCPLLLTFLIFLLPFGFISASMKDVAFSTYPLNIFTFLILLGSLV